MGINRWEEPAEIIKKLNELSKNSMWDVENQYYRESVYEHFESKCTSSKGEYALAATLLSDSYEKKGFANEPFPLVFKDSEGPVIEDIDGNMYLNFHPGDGETILGGKNKRVIRTIKEVVSEHGTGINLPLSHERILAKEIQRNFRYFDMVKFFNSRTEATMAAIRVARACTKRKKIIKIGGSNHGWYDDVMVGSKIPGSKMFLNTFGINRAALKYTKEVEPNNIEAMKKALKHNVAAVIVEPIGVDNGRIPLDYYYCKELREICDEKEVILIFDETNTAFRLGNGGVQEYLKVYPDITILGSVVGGGFPAAALGGAKKVMDAFSIGVGKRKKKTIVANGRHHGNPVFCAAGYAAIKEIVDGGLCQYVADLGDKMADGLNKIMFKYNFPFVAYNYGGIVHLEIVADTNFNLKAKTNLGTIRAIARIKKEHEKRERALRRINAAFISEGLILSEGRTLFMNSQMDNAVIEAALLRFEKVFINLVETEDRKEV